MADHTIRSLLENPLVLDLLRTANAEILAADERARANEARFENLKQVVLRLAEVAAAKVAAAEVRVSELESKLSSISGALNTALQSAEAQPGARIGSLH